MFTEGRPEYNVPDLDGIGDFDEGFGLGDHLPRFTPNELEARREARALETGKFVVPTNEQVFPSLNTSGANGSEGTNILPDQLKLKHVRAELAMQEAQSYE